MRRRERRRFPAILSTVVVVVLVLQSGLAGASNREIPLSHDGAVYRVPVTLNGWLVRRFIVDSGSAEVQVSTDLMRALFPPGAPPPNYLPGAAYRLADGRVVGSQRVLLPSLRVGDHEFRQGGASLRGPRPPPPLRANARGPLRAWRPPHPRRLPGVRGAP